MEKIIYALWKNSAQDRPAFNEHLLQDTAQKISELTHSVRVNIQDEAVSNGTSPRAVATDPQMDALIQIWVDTANDAQRAQIDDIVGRGCDRFEGWLVSESVPLPNSLHPPKAGQRTDGFSQIVFLRRPNTLSWEDWRDIWQNSHTPVATDTQSNFEYRQNLITRRLTPDSGHYDGIVEECFPLEALNDSLIYFDAPGDPDKMQKNLQAMMDSVARFIDHSRMDCIPTSQFDIKP